jgi:hypothetical protein
MLKKDGIYYTRLAGLHRAQMLSRPEFIVLKFVGGLIPWGCCYSSLIKVRKKYFGKNFRPDHIDQGGQESKERGLRFGAENLYGRRRRWGSRGERLLHGGNPGPARSYGCGLDRGRRGVGKWRWWMPRIRPTVLPKILQAGGGGAGDAPPAATGAPGRGGDPRGEPRGRARTLAAPNSA